MSNPQRRVNALENVLLGTSSGDTTWYAERLAQHSDSGITADEIFDEARRVHAAIGPPHTYARVAEYVAAEMGVSVDELLAGSERLRVEIEQAYPPS